MSLFITGVTISVDASEKEYGKGEARFASLKGSYRDEGVTLADIDLVVLDSLDMFLAAWRSLLFAKYTQGTLPGKELTAALDRAVQRTEKARAYLRKEKEADGQQQQPAPGDPQG
jgi:hypothetical protein